MIALDQPSQARRLGYIPFTGTWPFDCCVAVSVHVAVRWCMTIRVHVAIVDGFAGADQIGASVPQLDAGFVRR